MTSINTSTHPVTPATEQTTHKRFRCRHIFTDGHRCGSPCLRTEEFCFYHHTTRAPHTTTRKRRSRRSAFDLALPEDRSAIQCSIGEVLRRIASNDIDPRRAGLLLYGLQIASLNLPRPAASTRQAPLATDTIEEITLDPKLGTLAPRTEVLLPATEPTLASLLLDDWARHLESDPLILPIVEASIDPQKYVILSAAKDPCIPPPLLCHSAAPRRNLRLSSPLLFPQTPHRKPPSS